MPILYWPYFCEENIWHLCGDDRTLGSTPAGERRVVFISNARRRVALSKQRAGGGGLVLWDYHVVLLDGRKVWDLDSTLGCPVDLDVWVRESFFPLVPGYAPRFRVVDAATYRARFASDRSHMRDAEGTPLKPPPPWPRIGEGMTLMQFVDLESPFVGEVLDLETFARIE
jgi:hypothetical protein